MSQHCILMLNEKHEVTKKCKVGKMPFSILKVILLKSNLLWF